MMTPGRVVAIVLGGLLVAVSLLVLSIHQYCKARTTVEVTAIDEGYEICITTTSKSYLPIGPEGPFHESHQQTRWLAIGCGNQETIDGQTYKRYELGKNLETSWLAQMYSRCTIHVSDDANRLIVQGNLAPDKKYLINHSGIYRGIAIERPTIIPFSADTAIHDVNHHYIRAKGYLKDGQFKTVGRVFCTTTWFDGEAELVGRVYERSGTPPLLMTSGYKKITAKKK
jgi:hypothetical protein